MSISLKQKTAMAAILVAGALALLGILWTGGHGADDDHGHEEPEESHASEPTNEGLVRLTQAQIKAADIQLAQAGPAKIVESTELPGEIRFNEDRTAHIVPRLAGVVQSVSADLGQEVKKGQVLAVIASTDLSEMRSELLAAERRLGLAETTLEREKTLWEEKISAQQDYQAAIVAREETRIAFQNAAQKLQAIGASRKASSLNELEVRAPFDGMIVEKHAALGEAIDNTAKIFTISDLGTVWAEFAVAPRDLAAVRVGERVSISSSALQETTEGVVSYVGSLLGEATRTAKGRVTLVNPGMAWRPGLFITVNVLTSEKEAPIAVQASAIQTVGAGQAVFVQVPEGFRAQPVKTGRGNGVLVEVLEGLAPGTVYANSNTFTLKAELGKATAEHAH